MTDRPSWVPLEAEAPTAPAPVPGAAVAAEVDGEGGRGERRPGGPLRMHPMTIPDILDGAFTLLKANAKAVLLVSAVFIVPVQLLTAYLQRDVLGGFSLFDVFQDPSTAQALVDQGGGTGAGQGFVVGLASRALVLPALAGAVSFLVARSYLGEEVVASVALRVGLRRWWSLVVAWVLVHIIEFLAAPFLLLPGLLAMALFIPVAPIIAIEGVGAFKAMRRSVRLMGRRLFPGLGVALASGLLAGAVGTALGVIPQLAAYGVGLRRGWVILAAGTTITSLLTTPLIVIVATLVYFDARIRREGLDLEVMAAGL
ncbi:MAG: hypothetical protein ACRD0Q_00280 [Acidimicrobiales bacterium]